MSFVDLNVLFIVFTKIYKHTFCWGASTPLLLNLLGISEREMEFDLETEYLISYLYIFL